MPCEFTFAGEGQHLHQQGEFTFDLRSSDRLIGVSMSAHAD